MWYTSCQVARRVSRSWQAVMSSWRFLRWATRVAKKLSTRWKTVGRSTRMSTRWSLGVFAWWVHGIVFHLGSVRNIPLRSFRAWMV